MIIIEGYEITEQIYEGLRTVVYRGRRELDELPIVAKIHKTDYPSPKDIAKFRREFEIGSMFHSDCIIKYYDAPKYRNNFALILEDFGAVSLVELMPPDGMEVLTFLRIATQLAQAVGEIHQKRIIHKDIKPRNIVTHPEAFATKLIDFGISSQLSREDQGALNPNTLEGTLAYISPEQTGRMNRSLDYRTDFYSLGVTFYEMLTGNLPFEADDPLEMIHYHIAKPPIPPHSLPRCIGERKPDIPQALSAIVMKLLAKTAEERYQSAIGLVADLQTLTDQLQTTGYIGPLNVGEHDTSDRFQIPQKLYGRDGEIETLLAAFDRVSRGNKEMMLVSGYSGIGKSSLVNEIHKPIVARRGYFLSGRFDQFQQNIPYRALILAFEGLIHQLLSESEAQIAVWKEKLLEALGPNGQIIIDVIPEVELIIGTQPELPELPPTESQNRFNLVFANFVHTFARKQHPLVIFLDDLQWADSASLQLLERLMADGETGYLFLIGAFRDNEVNDAHPLMQTVAEMQKTAVVNRIHLQPLDLQSLNQLIDDTLSPISSASKATSELETSEPPQSDRNTNILADLIHRKTHGNPFFVNQFLTAVYEERGLTFDYSLARWEWDLTRIQRLEITDNVVELMADKLQKLKPETRAVLPLAACIGDQFDLHLLSDVHGKSPAETADDLWEALQEGLIVPIGDAYKFQPTSKPHSQSLASAERTNLAETVNYKFLHNRVQQAAYSLISEEEKKVIHLNIGRLMLRDSPPMERGNGQNFDRIPNPADFSVAKPGADASKGRIFDIVNHLNIAEELINEQPHRDELAELNLIAGRKALASAAYQQAFNYLTAGVNMLGQEPWKRRYDLTLALHEETAEAAYLNADFAEMERLAETVLAETKTLLEQINIYEVKIKAYMAQNKPLEAVKTALSVLKQLGVKLPGKPTKLQILRGLLRTKATLLGKRIEDLGDLPEMTAPRKLAAMRILLTATSAAYLGVPELFPLIIFQQVNLSVKYGNTAISAFAYAGYGLILCGSVGDIDSGNRFGELALQLLNKFDATEIRAKTLLLVYNFTKHWQSHFREMLKPLLEAHQSGLDTGDLEYACYAAHVCGYFLFATGTELGQLETELAKNSDIMHQLKQERAYRYNELLRQKVLNLLGRSESPCQLIGQAYDEEQMLPVHLDRSDSTALNSLYLNKLILCYLFGGYSDAVEFATMAEKYLRGIVGTRAVPMFYFYDSLARLAVYPSTPKDEQKRLLKKVAANQKKMKKWAHHAPMNHQHKYELVEAERARLSGQELKAMTHYDQAIAGARTHEFLNEEALSNELAAKFYLERGNEKIAQAYMIEARYAYIRWGAMAKVMELNNSFPQLFPTASTEPRTGIETTTTHSLTTENMSSTLDLSTVMKAAQTISGEIVLETLLEKLMRIVIENAGAQRGFLIMEEKGTLVIKASAGVASDELHVQQSTPVAGNSLISEAIINYVARARESVVLNNAVHSGQFTSDPYITKNQPKSVFCTPLIHQGKLDGILYLENNLTTGAFTPDRREVLNLLSTQAAISIENANLYMDLTEHVAAYERFVPHEFLSFLNKKSIIDVRLGEQVEKEMTIMFSDIRAFTTLSEQMSPEENFAFINSYLSQMEPLVSAHEGFIDKYLGDGIMALFPTRADNAVRGSISMLHKLVEYNQGRVRAGYQPIRIGIGLHTGLLILGTIGGKNRMDGTVISDAVNLASRIEDLTKNYGASLLISEQTFHRLEDPSVYAIRAIDRVRPKGKLNPVTIYEVLDGNPPHIIELKQQTFDAFQDGMRLYLRKQFTDAKRCFNAVLQTNPDDEAAYLYVRRCEHFEQDGVPADWEGVVVLEEK